MDNKLKQDHFKVATKKPEYGEPYIRGRGAQINTKNRFQKNESTTEHIEGIDVPVATVRSASDSPTVYLEQESKTIVNKIESKDVGMGYSMNPYAGCEHGCIY